MRYANVAASNQIMEGYRGMEVVQDAPVLSSPSALVG
ncbi:hypothetical protein METP1_01259 [Methanosarcinales archaeon]|nr:hypothetical protein METP1_01259 [Methanosarcinales archaeon]